MIRRILLAVDDSPDALAATRFAVELAASLDAHVRAVHVVVNHHLDAMLQSGSDDAELASRREQSATAILMRVADLATARGISVETSLLSGDVAGAVLGAARSWPADLVIVGRSFRSISGQPYVGAQTRHILEFADQPVLVVPPDRRRSGRASS